MRGAYEHWSRKAIMGGPNKSGHDDTFAEFAGLERGNGL
jgi:hypothetical protein